MIYTVYSIAFCKLYQFQVEYIFLGLWPQTIILLTGNCYKVPKAFSILYSKKKKEKKMAISLDLYHDVFSRMNIFKEKINFFSISITI